MRRAIPLLMLIAPVLAACDTDTRAKRTTTLFNTGAEIIVYGVDGVDAGVAAEALRTNLSLVDVASTPPAAKPLLRTNSLLRGGDAFSANPSLYRLIIESKKLYQKSAGAYNPALLGLQRQAYAIYTGAPMISDNPDLIALRGRQPTMNDIEIKGIRMRGLSPKIWLDFGLAAPGYAIDGQIEHLGEIGIQHAAVRIGGVTRVLGTNKGIPWTANWPDGSVIQLKSGEATCLIRFDDPPLDGTKDKRHALYDPKTGSVVKDVRWVGVVHKTALDAAATCMALYAAGSAQWDALIRKMRPIAAAMVDHSGKLRLTDGLSQRLLPSD